MNGVRQADLKLTIFHCEKANLFSVGIRFGPLNLVVDCGGDQNEKEY